MKTIIEKMQGAYSVIAACMRAYSTGALSAEFTLDTLESAANTEDERGENFIANIYREALTHLEEATQAMRLERGE